MVYRINLRPLTKRHNSRTGYDEQGVVIGKPIFMLGRA